MCVQLGNCIFSVLMNAGRSSPLVSLFLSGVCFSSFYFICYRFRWLWKQLIITYIHVYCWKATSGGHRHYYNTQEEVRIKSCDVLMRRRWQSASSGNLSTFQKVADGVITALCQATSQRVDWSRLVTCLHGNRDDREEACSGNFYNRDRKVLLGEQIIRTLLVIVGLLSLYVSLFFTVVSPLLP